MKIIKTIEHGILPNPKPSSKLMLEKNFRKEKKTIKNLDQ